MKLTLSCRSRACRRFALRFRNAPDGPAGNGLSITGIVAATLTATLFSPLALADYAAGSRNYAAGRFASAVYAWRQSAEQGDARSQYRLGKMYETGRGVPRDLAKAFKWYSLAADSEQPAAEVKMGDFYLGGQATSADAHKAAAWYARAARQGEAKAQFRLGSLLLEGRGVKRSPKTAARWIAKAAEQDLAAAQNNLGNLYENGIGVPRNYDHAAQWYRKAALDNDRYAQNNFARLYAAGHGVKRNFAWAVFWATSALAAGNQAAQETLKTGLEHLDTRRVTVDTANIRSGTSTDYAVLAKAHEGDTLPVLGRANGWTQVYLASEQRLGWIATRLLE